MHMKYPVVLLSGSTLGRPAHLPYIDTDFANKQRSSSSNVQVACLYEARMTIEFCGQGYLKYTCWAFADTTHEGESITEKDASDFSYTDPVEGSTELHEDPIAAEFTLEANRPLLDVRNYALQLLTLHLKKLVTKWKDAVELFDDPFGNHVRNCLGHRSLLDSCFGTDNSLDQRTHSHLKPRKSVRGTKGATTCRPVCGYTAKPRLA